jgi:hypothetical protein
MVRNGRGLRWASQSKGYENWVLWLKRFPSVVIEAIFWGWGVDDFPNRPPQCRSSDDPTQLDKPVKVGSVIQHLPHIAVAQRELDARELTLLGQPVKHVG